MSFDNLYRGWTRRTEAVRETIDVRRVEALAATLGQPSGFVDGEPLPAGWQWLFFNPVASRKDLSDDGHPRRDIPGSFLPPVPLPRRMWAGSRVEYLRDVPIGADATRTSRIVNLADKAGRAGRLCFVTVEHRISVDAVDCIVEEQDIVYKEAGTATAAPVRAPELLCSYREGVKTDTPLLFRYSALTFNGHRIHYDRDYATEVEGYRNLVVHGPLTATLLQGFARTCQPDRRISAFQFKGVSPLFVDDPFELQALQDPDQPDVLTLRAVDAGGALAMAATAHMVAP